MLNSIVEDPSIRLLKYLVVIANNYVGLGDIIVYKQ